MPNCSGGDSVNGVAAQLTHIIKKPSIILHASCRVTNSPPVVHSVCMHAVRTITFFLPFS